MSEIGVGTLANRMRNVIALYNGELTNADVVGTLEILKMEIYADIKEEDNDSTPDD